MIKLPKTATIIIIGKNIAVGTRNFLVEKVGIRLTCKKAIRVTTQAQNICERKNVEFSGKSKDTITGIITNMAAAGAGTPVKKWRQYGGGSSSSSMVLNRARSKAEPIAISRQKNQPNFGNPDRLH